MLSLIAFLSAASTKVVTVDYATKDHTAFSPMDYTQTSGTLSFSPGVTSQNINVTVSCPPPTTTYIYFDVNLSHAVNASVYAGLAYGNIYAGTAPLLCPAHTQCG